MTVFVGIELIKIIIIKVYTNKIQPHWSKHLYCGGSSGECRLTADKVLVEGMIPNSDGNLDLTEALA